MGLTDVLAGAVVTVTSAVGMVAGSAAGTASGADVPRPVAGQVSEQGSENTARRVPTPVARAGAGAAHVERWVWPLEPRPAVARRFDPPDQPWGAGHRGVDLSAEAGQAVRSPADGTVTFSGALAGRGIVVVSHDGGLRSTFEPVDTGPPVGTRVAAGATVGQVSGVPGHCMPATCLHWGVLRGSTYLDPLSLLGRAPVILLPLR